MPTAMCIVVFPWLEVAALVLPLVSAMFVSAFIVRYKRK